MKKILLSLFIVFLGLAAEAYIVPAKVSDIPNGAIGVYQVTNCINGKTFSRKWDYTTVCAKSWADNFFAILNEKKECSYLYATDLDEDLVEVIYDKQKNLKDWVNKEDSFQFLPWITFYNLYGRKYGLKILKDAPSSVYTLYSRAGDGQSLGRVIRPKEIRLTSIQGNWALVTVLDIESVKTGYIRWRGDNGELYLFPIIK